ncbi:MAG: phage tail assembly chaperone [Sulfuriferula sp.]
MPYFKAPDGKIHFLDNVDDAHLLPESSKELTDKQAQVALAPIPPTLAELSAMTRVDRDTRIAAVAWRYERNAREVRLGLPVTDDLAALDNYIQALSDISKQAGFPDSVVWPVL